MSEAILFFWVLVVLLAVAAGCNHGWHHRRSHLTRRLARASSRDFARVPLLVEPAAGVVDGDPKPRD